MGIERDDTVMSFPAVRDSGSLRAVGSMRGEECPDENVLVQLAEGALDGPHRRDLDRHLDTCAACSMLVAELARLAAPARSAPQRYKVIRQLGAGAMGVVWEAEDTSLQRKVALKFVKPEGVDDRALRKRLLREARALAQVRHPNVMALYDAGETDDEVCLVLELINGTNARAWRDEAPRTTAEIVGVWKQAAAGIAAVHAAGIVHRDIKPDNVFVADDGRVLVADFGLATGDGVDSTTSLTVSGAVIGTPLYMSPEQLQGRPATVQSDQFALCASIWEAVVGERPFRGSTIAAVVLAMSKLPELPKGIEPAQRKILATLLRGLDPDPAKRFPDVASLIAAIDPPQAERAGKQRRPLGWFTAGAVVLAVGGTVAVLAATHRGDGRTSGSAGSAAPGASGSATAAPGVTPDVAPSAIDGAGPVPTAPQTGPTAPQTGPSATAPYTGPSATAPQTGPNASAPAAPGTSHKIAPALPPTTAAPRAPKPSSVPSIKKDAPVTVREDVSFTHLMQRASDKLQFGDGAGCLKLIAMLPDVPDDQMVGVELVKIECRMATGDCAGAESAVKAFGARQGWSDDRIKSTFEAADTAYCPLDAPPQARWPARAQHRLVVAAGLGRSCKPVLDAIKKHHIVLPDPKQAAFMEIECLVHAGDCATAKQKYVELVLPPNLDPSVRPKIQESTEKYFHTSHKQCP